MTFWFVFHLPYVPSLVRPPRPSPVLPSPTPPHVSLQIETYRLTFRANARARTDHGADIVSRPPHFPGCPSLGPRATGSLSRAIY